jgi:hypothetical protein
MAGAGACGGGEREIAEGRRRAVESGRARSPTPAGRRRAAVVGRISIAARGQLLFKPDSVSAALRQTRGARPGAPDLGLIDHVCSTHPGRHRLGRMRDRKRRVGGAEHTRNREGRSTCQDLEDADPGPTASSGRCSLNSSVCLSLARFSAYGPSLPRRRPHASSPRAPMRSSSPFPIARRRHAQEALGSRGALRSCPCFQSLSLPSAAHDTVTALRSAMRVCNLSPLQFGDAHICFRPRILSAPCSPLLCACSAA